MMKQRLELAIVAIDRKLLADAEYLDLARQGHFLAAGIRGNDVLARTEQEMPPRRRLFYQHIR
jgi:hypothetical protein